MKKTTIADGQLYHAGDEIPDFKSVRCVDTSEPRKYIGKSEDASVLDSIISGYASDKASCLMTDSGEYYEFDSSSKKFEICESITKRNEPTDKIYGVLMRYVNALYSKVTQISTPIIFRGTVKNADLLPKNPLVGDMYNIEEKSIYGEAGMNVAWTGIVWDPLGPPINMGDYVKAETFKNLQSTVQKCLILID